MKKKAVYIGMAVLAAGSILWGCREKEKEAETETREVQIGVAVYNEKDAFISSICEYLGEEIYEYEKSHSGIRIRTEIVDAGEASRSRTSRSSVSCPWSMTCFWLIL